jgi:diguanylate cyclase (GGDEF)-like protein
MLGAHAQDSAAGPPTHSTTAALAEAVRSLTEGLDVAEVKIYDAAGGTVFSTEPKSTGEAAAAGKGLVEAHLPLRASASGPILGVMQLRLDATADPAGFDDARRWLIGSTLALTLALCWALGLAWRRSVRALRAHDEQHRASARDLQQSLDLVEARLAQRTSELERAKASLESEVAERKRNYATIREMAYFDGLTRLPNRAFIKLELERALASAKRTNTSVAVLLVDLDNFKRINDTFGHALGDELLRQTSSRLAACVRGGDSIASNTDCADHRVARLGGDEFTLLLHDVGSNANVAHVAQRVIDCFGTPFVLGIYKVQISASIGIAYYPSDGDTAEILLKNADTAMYHAKDSGRNNYQFYSRSMSTVVYEKLALENKLRRALERNEFVLHYQPKVDARTGSILGVEALIRWNSPEVGLIPPEKFIPLAEDTGQIVQIGEWVMIEACRQCKAWHDQGLAPLQVAVNVASPHFRQERILAAIDVALTRSGLPPQCLEVEVTESLFMDDMDSAIRMLRYLKEIGVKVSIDDFGTGYSSLSYLKSLPVDSLKIDRSFVKDLASSSGDAAITHAIIAMARMLGLAVVAEGVETLEQSELLLAQGCHEMQGFFFSTPVTGDEMTEKLKAIAATLPPAFGIEPAAEHA